MTQDEMIAQIAQLKAELARARAEQGQQLRIKVSEKGAVSVYGLGQFPVTLYAGQWDRLIEAMPRVKAFIAENRHQLSVKAPKQPVQSLADYQAAKALDGMRQ